MVVPGRWSTPPRRIINCASSYALAILESIVHWNRRRLPPDTRHVVVSLPDDIPRETVSPSALPGWNGDDYGASQSVGNDWYDRGESLILVTPSVLSPYESNILINQRHPAFGRLTVGEEVTTVLDNRLFMK